MEDETAVLLQTVKRQTVPTACRHCRSKKVKCDGHQPCGYCARRDIECVFETDPNLTPQEARKRKYNELSHRGDAFERLYESLAGQDEAKAKEIFQRIRRGDNLDSLFRYIETGSVQQDALTYDSGLRRLFLFSLVQSTAPLSEVIGAASSFFGDPRVKLPSSEAYDALRDRVVTIEKLGGLLTDTNPVAALEAPVAGASPIAPAEHAHIIWLPARPWVEDTSDAMVSHLMSIFFAYLNHSWRHVEKESFLRRMRSGDLKSEYCSPFLVNAILSVASLCSEINADFDTPEQLPKCGLQYHDTAVRMWEQQAGRAAICNIQALMILAMDCILRGKDAQGLNYLTSGSAMNTILPCPELVPRMREREMEYVRVRCSTWWMAVHVDLTYKMGILLGGDDTDWSRAPNLDAILPDTTSFWQGYPTIQDPIAFRESLLARYRCTFTRLLWEAMKAILWDKSELDSHREHAYVVTDLSRRLQYWYQTLPFELQFTENMPPALYDLHTQYYCVQMAIHERAYVQLFGPMSNRSGNGDPELDTEEEQLKQDFRARTLEFAYGGATTIRHYREKFGLKFLSFVHLNHSTLGVFVALNDLHANPCLQQSRPTISNTGPVQDTQSALEEFFRVLVATSLRWTMSRGLARAAYHTAQTLKIDLPTTIIESVRLMSGSVWQASDLEQLDKATYPNWSLPHVRKALAEDYRMGEMLKQWEVFNVDQPEVSEGSESSSRKQISSSER